MPWAASRPARNRRPPNRGPPAISAAAKRPAITDADLALGKLDPDNFAGGAIKLSTANAEAAIDPRRGQTA
jgi:N-methylhydantoinase A/oxoprolinase/acetone carboxylase beta subunit